MIKLTQGKRTLYVNPAHIVYMYVCEEPCSAPPGTTVVRFVGDQWQAVNESPEEILKQIGENNG